MLDSNLAEVCGGRLVSLGELGELVEHILGLGDEVLAPLKLGKDGLRLILEIGVLGELKDDIFKLGKEVLRLLELGKDGLESLSTMSGTEVNLSAGLMKLFLALMGGASPGKELIVEHGECFRTCSSRIAADSMVLA